MINVDENYICRICGLIVEEPFWVNGIYPDYSICPCCSAQAGINDLQYEQIIFYRKYWFDLGCPWEIPKAKPTDWDLEEQLKQIPAKWR